MRELLRLRRLLPVSLAVMALAALPSAASGASCTPTLGDGEGWSWDLQSDGTVDDGTGDAFDTYGDFTVAGNDYPNAAADSCGREDGDREITYPTAPVGATGLEFSRKVYVPTDDGFLRYLDTITNPTGAPVVVTVAFSGSLGSDGSTRVVETSDGDQTHTAADAWIVTDENNSGSPNDPTVSQVFDSTLAAPDKLDAVPDPFANTDDAGRVEYTNVTVPAGGSITFMHALAQNGTFNTQEGIDDAARLSRGPVTLYSGMSTDERARLQNFPADGDEDGDGDLNSADNCVSTANADQADLDADGQGDVCDDDIDGDGFPNGVETAVGSDPRNPDSDGDSVRDGSDRCPTVSGAAANNGCPTDDRPPAVELTFPADGAKLKPNAPTTLTATASDDAGVARVLFIDDAKVVCTDTAAPYTCAYQPKGEDVGRNTLAAVAVDATGQTAFDVAAVTISRFKAIRLTARSTPKADTTNPRRFTTRGRVVLPAALTGSDCKGATVRVTFKSGKKTISSKTVKVTSACSYRSTKEFGLPERLDDDKLRVFARFSGNRVLKAARAKVHKVTVK